ncbi:MAG: type II secretion system protein GspM [Desulfoplanes sp.]|nr:type II secretion system protein GspM [Desulfoplanes sp.]MDD4649931.1 type II secretion system protein GspM [Desulfoplanes sp.]
MFDTIHQRTRQILIGSVLAVVVILALLQWVIVPLQRHNEDVQAKIMRSRTYLQELSQLGQRYEQKKKSLERLGTTVLKRPNGFTLFAFVESQATKDGLRKHIAFMRPSQKKLSEERTEELVEMRLTGIDLDILVPYLFHVESAPEEVFVKRLTIRSKERNQNLLDVDLVLSAIL